jgi:hypothetical protein
MWPNHPDGPRANYPKLPMIEGDKVIDNEVTSEEQTILRRGIRSAR